MVFVHLSLGMYLVSAKTVIMTVNHVTALGNAAVQHANYRQAAVILTVVKRFVPKLTPIAVKIPGILLVQQLHLSYVPIALPDRSIGLTHRTW